MRRIPTALAMLLLLVAATSAAAQTGSLKVRVLDATDQTPLPGATVVLSNTMQFVSETAVRTDAKGEAFFPVLRAGGGYILVASMEGYGQVRKTDVRVPISRTELEILQLGETITEEVKVVAERDVIELEKTETSTSFGDEFIQDLPVQGRIYTNVLTLAPGVQDEDGDGNPNVHGSRERDFKAMVGGISNVDPLTGLKLTNINMDSIEEVEVITAGAGVEYGRAQGGYANIIEKQGSNDFEGTFNFIYRTSLLDGNGATNLTGIRLPKFDWIQPAVQVSGPIVKDKLWYRLSHELRDIEQPVDTLGAVEVTTDKQFTSSDMLTWQVSRRNKLAFSYLADPRKVGNVGVSSLRPAEASWTVEFAGPTYKVEWTAPYSPKLLVTSRVAYQDASLDVYPSAGGFDNDCVTGLDILQKAYCYDVTSGRWSGGYYIIHRDKRQRLTVLSDATIYGERFLGMSHTIKLGFSAENERYFRHLEQKPLVSVFVVTQENTGGGSGGTFEKIGFISGRFAVPPSTDSRAVGTNWAVYAEDVLKPFSNLTFTVGARVDREIINANGYQPFDPSQEFANYWDLAAPYVEAGETIPGDILRNSFTGYEAIRDFTNQIADALGDPLIAGKLEPSAQKSQSWTYKRRLANIDITNTNFAPFLSVSWDPFKRNKTKFAFSAGRHYDKIFLAVPLVENEPITTDLSFFARRQGTEWVVEEVCAGSSACLKPASNVSLVDRNLRTPYQDELTFTYEQELAAETALKVTLIRRKYKDQLQDLDLNHLPGDWGRCNFQQDPGDPYIVASWGEGQTLTDPYTGETYVDTDPGPGDGYVRPGFTHPWDDCVGEFIFPEDSDGGTGGQPGQPPSATAAVQRPDGFPDTYIQNPGWGEVYLVGNYNEADYKGAVVEIVRRQYKNWQMNGSYTWSKAQGDAEDWNQFLGDDRTTLDDEFGYLDHDQRHVVKLNATTIVPWAGGFRFGTSFTWQSGLPYSLLVRRLRLDSIAPGVFTGVATPEPRTRLRYVTSQRNDQRNESWWDFNVKVQKEMTLKHGMNLQLTAEIFNLLNDNSLRVYDSYNGFNDSIRRFGRRYQLGFRLAF